MVEKPTAFDWAANEHEEEMYLRLMKRKIFSHPQVPS